jgi:hypothetical protein
MGLVSHEGPQLTDGGPVRYSRHDTDRGIELGMMVWVGLPALPCAVPTGRRSWPFATASRVRFCSCIAAALSVVPTGAAAQTTFKIAMYSDLKSFDPVWSGAYIVRNYGFMVYERHASDGGKHLATGPPGRTPGRDQAINWS